MNTTTYSRHLRCLAAAAFTLTTFLADHPAIADGTETLGASTLPIVQGSGIVGAGVELQDAQPGFINFVVPAGTTIKQVILYWEGIGTPFQAEFGDDTIVINNSVEVLGTLIGGNEDSFGAAALDGTFRADITYLGLVAPGANSIQVGGLDFDSGNGGLVYGAGVLVVYSDGSEALVQVADGNDWAYAFSPNPAASNGAYRVTAPQSFTFPASSQPRTAKLVLSFGNISTPGFPVRPSSIEVLVGNVTNTLSNLIGAGGDYSWSVLTLDVDIPAGVTSVRVELFSRDDGMVPGSIPASFSWNLAALSTPLPQTNVPGVRGFGYWKNHPQAWCSDSIVVGGRTYAKDAAIRILKTPPAGGDKTYNLFHQLVAAKLNVCAGNDDSCVAAAIQSADWFLALYPPGSRVKANTWAWKHITPAFSTLGSYNEGELCVPGADASHESCDGSCENGSGHGNGGQPSQWPGNWSSFTNRLSLLPPSVASNLQSRLQFRISTPPGLEKKQLPVVNQTTRSLPGKLAAPVTKPQPVIKKK